MDDLSHTNGSIAGTQERPALPRRMSAVGDFNF